MAAKDSYSRMHRIGFTGSSPQRIHRELFTAKISPQGRFTAGQLTAEAIHRKATHRKNNSPQFFF
jgi:hypothetical protein